MLEKILRQRYKIVERIGAGAFGDTYLALDLDFPGSPQCVVKHLSPRNSESEAVKIAQRLFKTEAKVLSRLGKHDHIPTLHSYFEEDKQFYLVQEFIAGNNLTKEFQAGNKWSEAETVVFLQELLEILAFVHQNNTIHRDLKPANIIRRNSDRKLVLIDFGAVKEILTVDREGRTNLTDLTVGIGTLAYMPLEQAKGKPGKYSDIYAVGMLGIQALTGLPSKDLPQDSDKLKQVLDEEQIEISSELESVLSTMISFQPQNRYADASEALQALRPTEIIEPPEPDRPGAETKPKLLKKILPIAAGAIALVSGGIYALKPSQNINYAQLETYLQAGQWQQADRESDRLLLEIAGEDSALDAQAIADLSCKSLEKIDQLWKDNSNGRFGFTPQKQAYLATGNQIGQYTESTYQAFGDKVGWRTFGSWSLYGDLKFTDIAPVGHLPSPGKVASDRQDLRVREREMQLSRVDECDWETR